MNALDLFGPGAYARAVGGNLERPEIQAPVIDWMAWSINADNGAAGNPEAWDKCRGLWEQHGIAHFPWLHCRSIADVERLIAIGIQYDAPAIGLNIEDVVGDKLSLEEVADVVLRFWVKPNGGGVHMASLPWLQNDQGWHWLDFAVCALEIFPREPTNVFPDGYDPKACQDCIDHAFAEGLTKVTLMLGTKPWQAPQIYGEQFAICHSLYTADDIEPSAAAWNAWDHAGEFLRPVPPGGDMEKIGTQHGITAYVKWLREQPNVPVRGPGYDPKKIDTWPWPDKIERTLSILAADHDEAMV